MICLGFLKTLKLFRCYGIVNLLEFLYDLFVVVPIRSFQSKTNKSKNQQLSLREHWIIFRWYENKNLSTSQTWAVRKNGIDFVKFSSVIGNWIVSANRSLSWTASITSCIALLVLACINPMLTSVSFDNFWKQQFPGITFARSNSRELLLGRKNFQKLFLVSNDSRE